MRKHPARAPRVELRPHTQHLCGVERLELRCMLNGGPMQPMHSPGPGYSDFNSHSERSNGGFDHDGGYGSPSMQHDRGGQDSFGRNQSPMRDTSPFGDDWMAPPQQGAPSFQNGAMQTFDSIPQQSQPQQLRSEVIFIFVPVSNASMGFMPPPSGPSAGEMLSQVADRGSDLLRAVSHLAAPLPFDLGDVTAGVAAAAAAVVTTTSSTNQSAASAANRAAAASTAPATTIALGAVHLQSDHEAIVASLSPLAPKNSGSAPTAAQSAIAKTDGHASSGAAAKAAPAQAALAGVAALPAVESKAVLAEISLNLKRLEQSLESVMTEIGRLGEDFGQWVDENKLTCAAVGMTVVTLGAASAYYLRRRAWQEAAQRDDETSSNWLFVRVHTTVGDR